MAEVRTAATLADALGHLALDPVARPLAGGLGILLGRALESGGLGIALPPSGRWIDVRTLPELGGVHRLADGRCRVGAAVTIAELGSAAVPAVLRAAAASVGNPGVRAAGTVGGNLVGSGASSDLMAALVALGAVALVEGTAGARRVPVSWVPRLLGPDRALAGGSRAAILLRGVELVSAEPAGWGFERLTFQGAMDRSSATVAAVIATQGGRARVDAGAVRARIAATSVTDRAIRFRGTERRLAVDLKVGAADLEAAAAADLADVVLRSDLRVSGWYRRVVLPVLVRRAVEAAVEAALEGADPGGPA